MTKITLIDLAKALAAAQNASLKDAVDEVSKKALKGWTNEEIYEFLKSNYGVLLPERGDL